MLTAKELNNRRYPYVWQIGQGLFARLVIKVRGNWVTSVFTDGSGLRKIHVKDLRIATKQEVLAELRTDLKGVRKDYGTDSVN